MIEVLIPRLVHFDSAVPNQPQWDTLIGICNPFTEAQVFEIHAFDMDGVEQGSPLVYELVPGASMATTFIKWNVFENPPQNFGGYGKIIFPDKKTDTPFGNIPGLTLPVYCSLGGNGPTPMNWNYATPRVSLIGGLKTQNERTIASRWVFPYSIPFFDDPKQHHDEHSYRSALSITNLGKIQADLTIAFTRGDFYDNNSRKRFVTSITLAPGKSIAKYMHELIPELLEMNQEGWVDIMAAAPSDLIMYHIDGSKGFDFQAFEQSPYVIG